MQNSSGSMDLQIEFTYESESSPVLQIGENHIPKGKCVVLCGASGCGKTTLLRCMNQLIPQFYEGVLKGFRRIGGRDLAGLTIGETGKLAASVFQDPRSQFFTMNSTAELAFGLENFGIPQEQMEAKIQKAFEAFHLNDLADRDVFSLSSGQRQLIAILAAWVLDTDVFLLDEPTANLDFHAIEQLEIMLRKLLEQGKTLLISEHRLYYLRDIADEYWFMEHGTITQKLSAAQMQALPEAQRMQMGLRITDLDKLKNAEKENTAEGKICFCAQGISFAYPHTGEKILKGLSVEARQGEVIGLIGHNGCGKTSFGKLAAGLLRPDAGTFSFCGTVLSQKELANKSIFIMQEAEFQFFTNSVMNELCYGRKTNEAQKKEMEQLLRLTGLWECRNRHPFSLSGGQMQKLVLLLAYLSPKPVAVLDEPTAGLDYRSLENCAALIRKMKEKKIVFIITHDPELMAQVCSRCCSIEDGKISRNFDLTKDGEMQSLMAYMEAMPARALRKPAGEKPKKPLFDPRTKLFLFLLSMMAGIGADLELILLTFIPLMLVFLCERRYRPLAAGILLMGGTCMLYALMPGIITAFLISFFPRMLVICFGAFLLAGKQDISLSLAALRKIHVPEGIIMVVSVALRFFPVLRKDIGLMRQSIRTRGFFPGWSDKLRAIPEYLEILVVPMVFRVIRIAEALSASAETRGIALKNKRESYLKLKMLPADFVMFALAACCFAAGLLI